MQLGNGITTDRQLKKAMKKTPGFRGVYDRVGFFKIYPKMKAGDSVIINLDPHYQRGGSHWVALRVSNDNQYILYKDSFGVPPPEAFYRDLGRTVLYGTKIDQKMDEFNCGKRAAQLLQILASTTDDKKRFAQLA